MLADSVVTNEDYAKRAVELGHSVLSSCEHGNQGNYRECALLAEKYSLRWRYVSEAYFVKDRHEKDNTNCHIILAAKTAKGVGDLNFALSEANISGFYYRPRVDMELLLSLDPKDVFVTTACIAGVFKYGEEEAEKLILCFAQHFRDSFMLEVQYHDTEKQQEVNQFLLKLYRRHGIPLIMGTDSHFIYPEDAVLRQQRLEANHIRYEDESGWYMDYPSGAEAYRRFQKQGVLSDAQIREAIANTNVFLTFEDVIFDRSKKLPSIYPNLSQEERNQKYNVLSNLFDYAMDDENVALPRNPVKSKYVKVKYSESDSVIREPLPSEVVTEIISQIGTLPLMERRLMALLLFTGMRRGEVLGLRWEDLDFKTGFITVRRNATYAHNQAEVTTPKTSNGFRSLPLYAQLVEMLGTPKKSGYIIGEQKTPITGTAYQCMFEKIRKTVDLHGATAHVFRHSYLTMLDEAGVDPKTLQYIAGHGNFSFTMNRYVHGRKKAAQEAGVKFEKLINKASDSPEFADANISAFGASGKDKTVRAIS